MKIIAIGMNYSLHCHELHAGEALPQEPVIFMKPDSALLTFHGERFYLAIFYTNKNFG